MASMLTSSMSIASTKLWSSTSLANPINVQTPTLQSALNLKFSEVTGSRRTSRKILTGSFKLFCSASDAPTVSDTKNAFLTKYRRPIPNIYNSVIQELIVQQHLFRYNASYRYDSIFALGFVTVYDQLMDGYPSDEDRENIFVAYIEALSEDPAAYRSDAQAAEEWASSLNSTSIISFASKDTPMDTLLKDIAERSASGKFYYTRLFAIGLFRILELANASDPSVLDNLCKALGLKKMSVDRDLGVYRSLLNKLTQSKELMRDFLEREKKQSLLREKEKVTKSE